MAAVLWFDRAVDRIVAAAGSPAAVLASIATVLTWAAFGPTFHYSENWQLFINTGTTIITFWLGFLILRTQNRDTRALHAKLDALVKATEAAPDHFIRIEAKGEAEIEQARTDLEQRARNP